MRFSENALKKLHPVGIDTTCVLLMQGICYRNQFMSMARSSTGQSRRSHVENAKFWQRKVIETLRKLK